MLDFGLARTFASQEEKTDGADLPTSTLTPV